MGPVGDISSGLAIDQNSLAGLSSILNANPDYLAAMAGLRANGTPGVSDLAVDPRVAWNANYDAKQPTPAPPTLPIPAGMSAKQAGYTGPITSPLQTPDPATVGIDTFKRTPPAATTPAAQSPQKTDPLAVTPTGVTPDLGMYASSAPKYQAPQLQPANEKFTTPYYAAYTNDGDLAGAVMAGAGQKIRLVDAKTGQVVFEGAGPEGAQQAVGIANAVSEDKGRKAAWRIEADYGDKGWVAQAAERYDPKKKGIFGTLLDIAAPLILGAIFPPLAGVASALGAGGALATIGNAAILGGLANTGSGLIQGENLGQALKGGVTAGALSGIGAGVFSKLPSAITKPVTDVLGKANDALYNTIGAGGPLKVVLDPVNAGISHILDGAGNVISTVAGGVHQVQDAIASARTAIHGAFDGQYPAVEGVPSPGNVNFAVTPGDLAAGFDPFSVSPLTVTPPPVGPTLPGVTDISGLTVTGARPQNQPSVPAVDPLDLDGQVTDVSELTVQPPPATQPSIPTPAVPAPIPPDLTPINPVTTSGPVVSGNPTLPGVPTPAPDTNGFSIFGNAGTRSSLSPIYTKSLPPPTFGARQPRDVTVDQRYAIEHPEASFFTNVPQRGIADFAIPSPSAQRMSGIGDLNRDGLVDALDLAIWRARYSGSGSPYPEAR